MVELDLTTYTDDDLNALRIKVETEIERRNSIRRIPSTIEDLRQQFIASGGDPALVE